MRSGVVRPKMRHLKHIGEAMSKRKRIQFRITHDTPLGKYVEVREKQDGTDRLEYRYMGLQVSHTHEYLAETRFVTRDTIVRNGKVKRYIGDTQDVVTEGLTTITRTVTSIAGRDRPTKNKVAVGELRRKRHESSALSFGISKGKAYHKAKHS